MNDNYKTQAMALGQIRGLMDSKATEPPQITIGLGNQLTSVCKSVEELHQTMGRLVSKLEPLMRPDYPRPQETNQIAKEESASPVSSQARFIFLALGTIHNDLNIILDRLDL